MSDYVVSTGGAVVSIGESVAVVGVDEESFDDDPAHAESMTQHSPTLMATRLIFMSCF